MLLFFFFTHDCCEIFNVLMSFVCINQVHSSPPTEFSAPLKLLSLPETPASDFLEIKSAHLIPKQTQMASESVKDLPVLTDMWLLFFLGGGSPSAAV